MQLSRDLLGGASAAAMSAAGFASLFDDEEDQDQDHAAPAEEEDADNYLSVTQLRQDYLDYLTSKIAEIEEQKEARRYYHAAQLSETDRKVLEARGQPIVV